MTATASKSQSLIVCKKHNNIEEIIIDNELKTKVTDTVTILGVHIDDRLKSDSNILKLCIKASLHFSFILCHFKYSPLTWLFCSNDSQLKMEKINRRALRLALSDYSSTNDELLNKTKLTTVHIHPI